MSRDATAQVTRGEEVQERSGSRSAALRRPRHRAPDAGAECSALDALLASSSLAVRASPADGCPDVSKLRRFLLKNTLYHQCIAANKSARFTIC